MDQGPSLVRQVKRRKIPMNIEKFSDLIRHLYEATHTQSVEAFQRQVINNLATALNFDSAWWGRATVSDEQHRVHYSYLHNLPEDVPLRLNLTDPTNLVAQKTFAYPGVVHAFSNEDWSAQESTLRLARHMNIEHALCVSQVDASAGFSSFLSLGRAPGKRPFHLDEQELLGLIMPHMALALNQCCIAEIASKRNSKESASILADSDGWIRAAESGALALLQSEWGGWSGSQLPVPLLRNLKSRNPSYSGKHVSAVIKWVDQDALIQLRRAESIDLLSPREKSVAHLYAVGGSYLEVARELGLAPATVRHHLRSIYKKLGVKDKGELSHYLTLSEQ